MLSGRSPFLGHHHHPQYTPVKSNLNKNSNHYNNDDSVASIIRRIKNGDFRMDSDSWKYVSPAAKSITRGLLTVDVKKRLTMEALFSSSWINNTLNNNNNPPALLMTPLILNEPKTSMHVIDRNLKQTFNAFHTVARETFLTSGGLGNCLLMAQPRSSSVSSSTSSGASSICDGLNKAVAEYLQSQQFLIPSQSTSLTEALTGVSYHLLPASTTSVSITKMGPMTRSRKRKMQDPPTVASSASTAVTVIKRERSEATSIFPMASTASAMQYCATARAVVVTPSATWTPTSVANATARSVTITID